MSPAEFWEAAFWPGVAVACLFAGMLIVVIVGLRQLGNGKMPKPPSAPKWKVHETPQGMHVTCSDKPRDISVRKG